MKVVTAFDSYKGCLSAADACRAAAEGILQIYPEAEIEEIPLSDGGEGLVNCVQQMLNTETVALQAHGPLMETVEATYALSQDGKTAYMEMAAVCGLPLVPPEKRNPLLTTTYGVGDLILDALSKGCNQIILGIGGSATNDGGQGMIRCLQENGLLDGKGRITDPRLRHCRFLVACDVNNPLCGPNGASVVFGPQKGAMPEQVKLLDRQLQDFDRETVEAGIASAELKDFPGTGAAGGLGYGLMAYLNAELKSGIQILLDLVHFDARIQGADCILTGEGKSDEQTLMGKVPQGVLLRAQAQQIPVFLLSGAIDDPQGMLTQKFSAVQSINEGDPRPLSELLKPEVAQENLLKAVSRILR